MSKWFEMEVTLRRNVMVEVADDQTAYDAKAIALEEFDGDAHVELPKLQGPLERSELADALERADDIINMPKGVAKR